MKYIKMIFLLNGLLFLSSCMMLAPNHTSSVHQKNPSIAKDIVCGDSVDINQTQFSTVYLDNTYYFDSVECLNKFKQAPKMYVNNNQSHSNTNWLYWGAGAAAMGAIMLIML
jgi:YHS domain-containing protein